MRRYLLIAAGLLALLSPAKAADSTVSAMTAASGFGGTELLYIVQGGADRKGQHPPRWRPTSRAWDYRRLHDYPPQRRSPAPRPTAPHSARSPPHVFPATGIATFLATPSQRQLCRGHYGRDWNGRECLWHPRRRYPARLSTRLHIRIYHRLDAVPARQHVGRFERHRLGLRIGWRTVHHHRRF